ncbi:hypothetical protein [Pseudomonas sp. USHLN015]|uniref:hypothetical protein n=1 Tax=Pseudomonas sp. USHLN015 TaxID=3081296 RepID=UPI00301B9947
MNLKMHDPELVAMGWVRVEQYRHEKQGHSVTAEFGTQDGFPCWMYRTRMADGRSFGVFPTAIGAAKWIERELVREVVNAG